MNKEQFNWKNIQRHLMTGIGYMIPVIVAAGVVMGVAQITGLIFGFDVKTAEALADPNGLVRFLAWMNQYAAPQSAT